MYSPIKPKKSKKQFVRVPKWLSHFNSTSSSLTLTEYHYFSTPVQGYRPVTLYTDEGNTQKMYLETTPLIEKMPQKEQDNSGSKDFSFLDYLGIEQKKNVSISRQNLVSESEWAKRYEPRRFIDLLSDDKNNRVLLGWLKSWDPIVFGKQFKTTPGGYKSQLKKPDNAKSGFFNNYGGFRGHKGKEPVPSYPANKNYQNNTRDNLADLDYRKIVLLAGPPGCGKTTLARVLARHCKYNYQEINASDDRSANALISKISGMSNNQTIRADKKPTMIIIDQVDGALESDSNNGLKAVINYIETGKKPKDLSVNDQKLKKTSDIFVKRPIIFICNDPYAKGMKELRTKATVLYFTPIHNEKVIKRLKQILQLENLYIQTDILNRVVQICCADIRSCLGLLQLVIRMKTKSNIPPKQFLSKLKLSFNKDSQQTVNEFISDILYKKLSMKLGSYFYREIQKSIHKIGNPSLLLETFMANIFKSNQFKNMASSFVKITSLYESLRFSDFIIKKDFQCHGQLARHISLPFCLYQLQFKTDQVDRIEFPRSFYDYLSKSKTNKAIVEQILGKTNSSIICFTKKRQFAGHQLWTLFWAIQPTSLQQTEIVQCLSRMIAYGVEFASHVELNNRKMFQHPIIFKPEFEHLFTYAGKRPEELQLSNSSKTLMEQSYEFVKTRMQILSSGESEQPLKAGEAQHLLNKLNLNAKRRKRLPGQQQRIRYKYEQGSGTQIICELKLGFFA